MLPNDMYYMAVGLEPDGPGRRTEKASETEQRQMGAGRGTRRLVGRALIGLGELIAAEPRRSHKAASAGR